MKKLQQLSELKALIFELEQQQESSRLDLISYSKQAISNLNPVNVIQSFLEEKIDAKALSVGALNGFLGIGAGYISKLLFQGASHNSARKMFGTTLMLGVATIIARNPDRIKELVKSCSSFIRSYFTKPNGT